MILTTLASPPNLGWQVVVNLLLILRTILLFLRQEDPARAKAHRLVTILSQICQLPLFNFQDHPGF